MNGEISTITRRGLWDCLIVFELQYRNRVSDECVAHPLEHQPSEKHTERAKIYCVYNKTKNDIKVQPATTKIKSKRKKRTTLKGRLSDLYVALRFKPILCSLFRSPLLVTAFCVRNGSGSTQATDEKCCVCYTVLRSSRRNRSKWLETVLCVFLLFFFFGFCTMATNVFDVFTKFLHWTMGMRTDFDTVVCNELLLAHYYWQNDD